jgi:hypothetical protein
LSSEVNSPAIDAAQAYALHAHGACEDMAAVLFPRGRQLPSEALQAAVRTKLHDLILSLELKLQENESAHSGSQVWQKLCENGGLRSAHVMAFALARVSEEQLNSRVSGENSDAILSILPSRLLGSASEPVAALARNLLAAEQACRYPQKNLYTQLEPALLNRLVWQVAGMLIEAGGDEAAIKLKAQTLLANHQMANQLGIAAQKLLFAIGPDYKSELYDPARAGLALFVAELEREFSLPRDTILRMIDADTAAPLSMLLSMRGLSREIAAGQIELLRGRSRDDQEIASILQHYDGALAAPSKSVLDQWRQLEGSDNAV